MSAINLHNTPYDLQNNTYVADLTDFTHLYSVNINAACTANCEDSTTYSSLMNFIPIGTVQLRQHKVEEKADGVYGDFSYENCDYSSFTGTNTGTTYTYDHTSIPQYSPGYAYPTRTMNKLGRYVNDVGFLQSFNVSLFV